MFGPGHARKRPGHAAAVSMFGEHPAFELRRRRVGQKASEHRLNERRVFRRDQHSANCPLANLGEREFGKRLAGPIDVQDTRLSIERHDRRFDGVEQRGVETQLLRERLFGAIAGNGCRDQVPDRFDTHQIVRRESIGRQIRDQQRPIDLRSQLERAGHGALHLTAAEERVAKARFLYQVRRFHRLALREREAGQGIVGAVGSAMGSSRALHTGPSRR